MIYSTTSLLICAITSVSALTLPRDGSSVDQGSCWSPWKPGVGAAVNTSSGTVIGHAAQGFQHVSEYLGIPFARPPVGDLRFAAPQPFVGHATIHATTPPLSCPQEPSTVNYSQPENWQEISIHNAAFANHTSEDCLYLNIWSKAASKSASKPVLVWFYGGGFHSGGASDPSQSGAQFADEQDIVMVSFNYRLGIFGFSGAPNAPANTAFLDQRLAVQWVRDNIAGFGGDPNKIIIFGHSAGAASVDYYSYAYTSDPIISGYATLSGSAMSFGNRYPNTTEAGWSVTASLLGCGNLTSSNAEEVLTCMRSKPANATLAASLKASKKVGSTLSAPGSLYAGITGIFGPTIDNKTVFENYTIQGKAGKFIDVPMLAGNTNGEGCFYIEEGKITPSQSPTLTEAVFTCPIEHQLLSHANKGVTSWKYRYYGGYPNLYAPACPGETWHGGELYVIFGTSAFATEEPATQQELEMGTYFRKVLATFAHDPSSGLSSELSWPTFNSNEDNAVALARNGTQFPETVMNVTAFNTPCFTELTHGAANF